MQQPSGGGRKILEVTAAFPPYRSGTGTTALHNSIELARRGFDVTVLTPGAAKTWEFLQPGVRVLRYPLRLRIGLAGFFSRLGNLGGFDAIHLHAPFIGGGDQVVSLARKTGIRLLVTYHQDLSAKGLRGAAFELYMRFRLPAILQSADAIIVPSIDSARRSLLWAELARSKELWEIPGGADTHLFSPGPPLRKLPIPWGKSELARTFLFVGALDRAHYFKGVEILLEATSQLTSIDARLVIVGDGDLRARYENATRWLGLNGRVFFAGNVPQPILPDYYRGTVCTVLPSTTQGEIFGLSLVEAMSCGKPTIASDLPGVRTIVDHGVTGFLVPAKSPSDLATAMERILGNKQTLEMGNKGREKVLRQYDWSTIGRTLSTHIGRLLESDNQGTIGT